MIRTVCVYCGSSLGKGETYRQAAVDLGRGIGNAGMGLVYGGGRIGLMGVVADSALSAGAEVTGIIPEHIQVREVEHTGLHELLIVDSMHERKRLMVERSDAFIVLPGGLGTLDETFEILTWRQLGLHSKPVILFNLNGYWNPLLDMVDHIVDEGFMRGTWRDFFHEATSVEAVLDILQTEDKGALHTSPARL